MPVHRALRPPDPGQGRRARSTSASPSTPTTRSTTSCASVSAKYGIGFWEPGCGHHPPGRARELRLPRRDDDRHRQPHAQRRRPRHGRHRRRRRRRRRRDDRLPVQRALAEGHRRARSPARSAAGRARRTSSSRSPGSSPSRAAPARSSSTSAPAPTRSRPPARRTICNMGAEIGATTLAVPLRRQHGRVPQGHRPRGDRRRRRHGRRRPARRRRGLPTRRVLRPGDRDRPRRARAAASTARTPPTCARPRRPSVGAAAEAKGWPLEISRRARSARAPTRRYEDITRAASIARQAVGRRACTVEDRAARSRPAPSRSGPRSSATACSPTSRRSAPPCSPTPAARASASGHRADIDRRRRQHDRQLVQPQLPEAQRRLGQHAGVRHLARDGRSRWRWPAASTSTRRPTRSPRPTASEVHARGARRRGAARARASTPARHGFIAPPADGSGVEVEVVARPATGCSCSSRSRRGTATTTSTCRC